MTNYIHILAQRARAAKKALPFNPAIPSKSYGSKWGVKTAPIWQCSDCDKRGTRAEIAWHLRECKGR